MKPRLVQSTALFAALGYLSARTVTAVALTLLSACRLIPGESNVRSITFNSSRSDGFTNFETEPVRPVALSADGHYLYVLNTADDRLEIFDTRGETLRSLGETTVGLRPVALAVRENHAWVVNHLSDSVSVVDVSNPRRPRVTHTLQVGDEPRGIVFGGLKHDRVFVATGRQGDSFTPSIGRAQLWIFDARRPKVPPRILTLFGTKPRALAASADGRYVYAAVFLSGNGTTTVSGEDAVRLGRIRQLQLQNVPYSGVPKQGAIVRRHNNSWRDFDNRDWTAAVPFDLPDYDLFVIDTALEETRVVGQLSNIGTVLFNIAVKPGSGEIWISNSEAFNFMPHEPRLKAKFAENRITRIYPASGAGYRIQAVNLNSHVDHSAGGKSTERELGLAQPLDLVFQPDGTEAYVAAFGSGKIGVLDEAARLIDRIAVGFGPGGLALDAQRQRLYVLNHLDPTVSAINLRTRNAIDTVPLRHNPTPEVVRRGRPFLYDAALSSRGGDLSCATCHVFADLDGLAWDLA